MCNVLPFCTRPESTLFFGVNHNDNNNDKLMTIMIDKLTLSE